MPFSLSKFYSILVLIGNFLQPFFLLAIRIFWGWQFFTSGLAKYEEMAKVSNYFSELGIPLPTLSAYLVASIELIGGVCLLLGLASRFAAIPLIITMLVALFTAHHEAISMMFSNPSKVLAEGPFTFLMAALTIFIFGPGIFSFDAAMKVDNH